MDRGAPNRYVVTGEIERRENRHVLVDDNGDLEAYLIPKASIDLDRFVGKAVKLTVREPLSRHEREPRYWVDEVSPLPPLQSVRASLSFFEPSSPWDVQSAQYYEPLEVEVPGETGVLVGTEDEAKTWGPPGGIWGSVEYLLWWGDGMDVPPLVTTSPLGTAREDAGVLGQPNTQILYGGGDTLNGSRNGLRLRGGSWFDSMYQFGWQGEYFGVASKSEQFFAASDGAGHPILARPFFNMNPRIPVTNVFDPPAREDSALVSFPDELRGSISVNAKTDLQSFGLAFRTLLAAEGFSVADTAWYSRADMVAGYRYMRLSDHLGISEEFSSLNSVTNSSFQIYDRFDTSNEFNGFDVGAVWRGGWQKWSLELMMKTALGNVHQSVKIDGGTTITQPNAPVADYAGGLLALPSNMGQFSRDRFAVIPELGANLGFMIFPRWRASVGYTVIFWGPVVRPGDQIDRDINPDQLPPPIVPVAGALRPVFAFENVNYWVNGLTFGLEGRW